MFNPNKYPLELGNFYAPNPRNPESGKQSSKGKMVAIITSHCRNSA